MKNDDVDLAQQKDIRSHASRSMRAAAVTWLTVLAGVYATSVNSSDATALVVGATVAVGLIIIGFAWRQWASRQIDDGKIHNEKPWLIGWIIADTAAIAGATWFGFRVAGAGDTFSFSAFAMVGALNWVYIAMFNIGEIQMARMRATRQQGKVRKAQHRENIGAELTQELAGLATHPATKEHADA